MGHDDQDGLLLTMQVEQHRRDVVGRRAVEVAGRLVAQEQARPPDQRAGDRGALPFAARQRRRPMVAAAAEPDLFDQRRAPVPSASSPDCATSVGMSTFSSTVHCGSRQ